MERLAKDKHSSLLRAFVNYRRKKLCIICSWLLVVHGFVHNQVNHDGGSSSTSLDVYVIKLFFLFVIFDPYKHEQIHNSLANTFQPSLLLQAIACLLLQCGTKVCSTVLFENLASN
jgi:hypothetical protein